MFQASQHHRRQRGIILLVVLSALAFFSVLVATYLVFSNEARTSSFAIAKQSTYTPDIDALMDDALMTLIRGTNDPSNPFFGEDLLSDYYGRNDQVNMQVHFVNDFSAGPQFSRGFVRFPVSLEQNPGPPSRAVGLENVNDVLSGRLLTFIEGPLQNRTFRVLRSVYVPPSTPAPPALPITEHDNVFIELDSEIFNGVAPTAQQLLSLFYRNPDATNATSLTLGSFRFTLNGSPRNARGLGFDPGTQNLEASTTSAGVQQPSDPNRPLETDSTSADFNPPVGLDLPLALQPNHLGRNVNKGLFLRDIDGDGAPDGDFDEDYDAPDHLNWFLSHRFANGDVIPSFHRPAVLNYLLNQVSDWSAASDQDFRNIVASLSRATFRPFPIAENQLAGGSNAVNPGFSGSSDQYALRVPISMGNGGQARLDQLSRALILGAPDIDNDADGNRDSIWMNLGLPLLTSPEGKLIQPMIAPMIEDLGGRLNLNAIGNPQLPNTGGGLATVDALWARTATELSLQFASGGTPANEFVFRGIGWGPADMTLPMALPTTTLTADQVTNLNPIFNGLINSRYQFGLRNLAAVDVPGRISGDSAHLVRFGYRAALQSASFSHGYSEDPFGRGGIGMGISGHVVAAESGTTIVTPSINEASNQPYEIDPTGVISGDSVFSFADFEALLRQFDFDTDLLPSRLADEFNAIAVESPELAVQLAASLTPHSRADDVPASLGDNQSPYLSLVRLLNQMAEPPALGGGFQSGQVERVLAPELRLGQKIDLNRRFGNLVDDNANGVIDEPIEVARTDNDGLDNDGDTVVDEQDGSEAGVIGENQAFAIRVTTESHPAGYNLVEPNYTLGSSAFIDLDQDTSTAPTPTGDQGRQLLARHLYVLMMMLTRDIDAPDLEAPDFPVDPATDTAFGGDADRRRQLYRARRIAQWAINVVDYRDPDSIMTPFEYDPDPFDAQPIVTGGAPERIGWDVDGDISTRESLVVRFSRGGATSTIPSPVVWGVEEPDLVFSESLAFHNLNVRDTDRDDNTQTDKMDTVNPDPNTDQVRLPQGTLMLELYCPRPVITNANQHTKPAVPRELYNVPALNTGVATLDLDRQAPALPGQTVGAPVWRIGITSRHDAAAPGGVAAESPLQIRDTRPDTASFDFAQIDEVDETATGTLTFDRFIFFRDFTDTDTVPDTAFNSVTSMLTNTGLSTATDPMQQVQPSQVFYAPTLSTAPNVNQNRDLQPGQYLTLAPRVETVLGSREVTPAVHPGVPGQQRFSVVSSPAQGIVQTAFTGLPITPTMSSTANYMPALPMVIAAPRPGSWVVADPGHPNLQDNVVGLSVSEPLPRGGAYYPQPTLRFNGTLDQDVDTSEDYLLTDGYIDFSMPGTNTAFDEPLDVSIGRLPVVGSEVAVGTLNNYCTAVLQRLADPTRPFNEVNNPYRTIDLLPVDLTVFTGEDRDTNVNPGSPMYASSSRQRNGFVRDPADPTGMPTMQLNALYSYETSLGTDTALDPAALEYFQFAAGGGVSPHVENSLSFLNTLEPGVNPNFTGFAASVGSLGVSNITTNDRNLPQTPFAFHPWLNRNFATPAELMLVPACSQARLFEEFTVSATGTDANIYSSMPDVSTLAEFRGPFRHLMNFFTSTQDSSMNPELHRIFDFVHTRPRFAGELDALLPGEIRSLSAVMNPLREVLEPPYSFLYDNQRVGTVNLNSISQFQAWVGLMQGHLNPTEFNQSAGSVSSNQLSFDQFLRNRRGYDVPATGGNVTAGAGPYNYDTNRFSPSHPTEFAAKYRTSTNGLYDVAINSQPAPFANLRRRGVHAGLLRGNGTLQQYDPETGIATQLDDAFFVRDQAQLPTGLAQPHANRHRNPFVRYQTLMRMPNLVSNNSNVFLIRMTLGFFEVDAQTGNLGIEYNSESGRQQRHRSMFVVDRSIPVGFIPGQDTNARDIVIFESQVD